MFVLGVTGGIGTGKSTVSGYFRDKGVEVLDADEISRTAAKVNAKKVDPTTPGTYEVYYYYTGLSGEIATAILTVVVE